MPENNVVRAFELKVIKDPNSPHETIPVLAENVLSGNYNANTPNGYALEDAAVQVCNACSLARDCQPRRVELPKFLGIFSNDNLGVTGEKITDAECKLRTDGVRDIGYQNAVSRLSKALGVFKDY